MHLVILVVLVVAVYGRDLSDAGYYPAQPFERYDTQRINSPPPEVTDRRYEGNDPNRGNYETQRPIDLNNNRQVENNEDNRGLLNNDRNGMRHNLPNMDNRRNHGIENDPNRGNYETQRPVNLKNNRQVENNEHNRDLLNNDRNGRRNHSPNMDHRPTHGVITDMDVNLAFERQAPKTQRDGNLNLPKQSFSVDNEYAKRVDVTKNDSNRSQNLPTRRSDGDMVFKNDDEDQLDNKNTPIKPNTYNSNNNDAPEMGIVSFLNNIDINNTNQNVDRNKQNKTQHNESNNNQIGFKSDTVSNRDQRPSKTTIENEVTPNPFRKDSIPKENKTLEEDKWIWGDGDKKEIVEATTDTTTLVTLDDRAAFDGGKCASGMARVKGICISID